MQSPGEKTAWEIVRSMDHRELAGRAGVPFENGSYVLRTFGADVLLDPQNESIGSTAPAVNALLQKAGYFYNHLALWWLVNARGITATGRLIRPTDLAGGQMFFRGTHVLPLDKLAQRYARDEEGFIKKAKALGGEPASFGDASAVLFPINGLPVNIILWLEDDEFPARADLLLDSAWELAVPLDIIWCASMLSVLAMS
jgi:hypothetical protein